jgi:hypothetical protein
MYIKLTNGSPTTYSIGQLRRDNPQVSFSKHPSESTLAEYDVYPVSEISRPEYDARTHYLKQSEFYQVDGKWQLHYTPEQLPYEQVANRIRAERDELLRLTDWIVSKSYESQSPVSQEWVEYRQALRDIPQQEGFPYEVQWPVEPE